MTNMEDTMEVTSVEYHRNGVGGTGFYVVQFTAEDDVSSRDYPCADDGGQRRNFVATVFPEAGNVAVLATDDFEDKWRGDHFEDNLRYACYHVEVENVIATLEADGTVPTPEAVGAYMGYEGNELAALRPVVNRVLQERAHAAQIADINHRKMVAAETTHFRTANRATVTSCGLTTGKVTVEWDAVTCPVCMTNEQVREMANG